MFNKKSIIKLSLMSETLPTVDFMAGVNSSSSNLGIGRATKKVHIRSDLHIEFDDPTMDSNE